MPVRRTRPLGPNDGRAQTAQMQALQRPAGAAFAPPSRAENALKCGWFEPRTPLARAPHMKAKTALALLPLLVGCSSSSTSHETFQPPADPPEKPDVPPTVLVTGQVGLIGVTSDHWAVYRGAAKLEAV